jgi:thioredoxin 1
MKAFIITIIAGSFLFTWANMSSAENQDELNEGINFYQGSWDEALKLAKKENKPIFLDIYASWCGPCKALKKNTFSDSEVGEYYNANFINLTIDGEKGNGVELADNFQITGYPSLIFVNADGELIGKITGYHNPRQFLELGRKVIDR